MDGLCLQQRTQRRDHVKREQNRTGGSGARLASRREHARGVVVWELCNQWNTFGENLWGEFGEAKCRQASV